VSALSAYTLKFSQDQVAVQGSGILADIADFINPTAGILAKVVGLGVKSRCVRCRQGKKRGEGILEDLISFGGKTLANFAIDKGVDYAKSKIYSFGTGLIRTATPKQYKSLKRVRALKTLVYFNR
jgi:hypothetical protein